ncbi:MAG: BMP family ABC transporter substrate-binding protein, partial [Chloroflexota bacterium]
MSKKIFTMLSLLIIGSMLFSACSLFQAAETEAPVATEAPATEADCGKEEVLCVGLVTDVGEIDDK